MHIAAAIGDHQDANVFVRDPVNSAVGSEEVLSVFAKPYGNQFLCIGTSLPVFSAARKGLLYRIEIEIDFIRGHRGI